MGALRLQFIFERFEILFGRQTHFIDHFPQSFFYLLFQSLFLLLAFGFGFFEEFFSLLFA